ncbi:unnamed protein product [Larinioides sclopetarius]|uniref:Uncharacterized protein n=1 Tax=Larinioides sclopetarius TaxID=280406 RepID=A0AAV2B5R8_9ARAC
MSLLYPEFPGMYTVATLISKFANLKTVYQRNKKNYIVFQAEVDRLVLHCHGLILIK